MFRYLGLLLSVLVYTQGAVAQDDEFTACISELQQRARTEKISDRVVDEVLGQLQQQPRVIELDRSQPEFTQTFANYFYRRVTPQRIARGQELLAKHDRFLSDLTRRYGIPRRYLVALWGLETNYGANLGRMPTLDSLATLACDERRSEYFTNELMQALILLEREALSAEQMLGSWAGAMGHTQFMPSAYTHYAVDGDGDGQVNLWKSEQDALASGANYLENLGWQRCAHWGREVLLPSDFPYSQTGLENSQPLAYWRSLGVQFTSGMPMTDTAIEASVLVPAGHSGPAFLVYSNFSVILEWNRSEYYALAVGLLADRLIGAGPLLRPPSLSEAALSRSTVEDMQRRLNHLGFDAGEIDGIIGSLTQSALRNFQASNGMIADGYPDRKTLCALAVKTGPTPCL